MHLKHLVLRRMQELRLSFHCYHLQAEREEMPYTHVCVCTVCRKCTVCTHTQCIFFLFSFFLSCLNLRKQNRLNSLLAPYGRIWSTQVLSTCERSPYPLNDAVNLSYYLQRNNYPWRNATLQKPRKFANSLSGQVSVSVCPCLEMSLGLMRPACQ